MAVLQPSEYDASYFKGSQQSYTHNAGYSDYDRVATPTKGIFAPTVPIEQSTGNSYWDLCKALNIKLTNRFVGKKLLVIGCAYGFEVEGLRSLGIDAWGIDVSAFAIAQAKPAIQPYLEVADARTKVISYKRNEWDYIFSQGFLECMSDDDLTVGTFAGIPLLSELTRICRSGQVHIVHDWINPLFYNQKTITQWAALPFAVGTIFVNNYDFDNYVTKIN